MTSPNQITVSQLSRLIGTSSSAVIVDVCRGEDFEADPRLVATDFRHPYDELIGTLHKLTGKRAVAVCQNGLNINISGVAAAMLRLHGLLNVNV